MPVDLDEFLAHEGFSTLDRHLARQLVARAQSDSQLIGYAAALGSLMLRQGHVCLDLSRPPKDSGTTIATLAPWPDIETWRNDLARSGLVAIGEPDFLPLVLDSAGRLYLHRYDEYERSLAKNILARVSAGRFRVIVGGPGTGKTTRIIDELLAVIARNAGSVIALAAPTGKAAHRMEESLRRRLEQLETLGTLSEEQRAHLPRSASTLHRLLGSRNDSPFFKYDAKNPLPADVVIVDEASMVDLPLMAKLFAALKPAAEIVLVGDPHQLASVEAGAVLADIAIAASKSQSLGSALISLEKQYRYGAQSGIGLLCDAIREGDGERALALLGSERYADIRLRALPERTRLASALGDSTALVHLRAALTESEPGAMLAALGRNRILCPLRRGPFGVDAVNEIIEGILDSEDVIRASGVLYERRPIVLTRNDHDLQLYNGDSGVVIRDPQSAGMQVFFPSVDGALRAVPALRLPPHETAFALTVHRSQGSEFDRALVILPPTSSPIMTRELLYTAVSRARNDVEIWGDPQTLLEACKQTVERTSGLVDRLC